MILVLSCGNIPQLLSLVVASSKWLWQELESVNVGCSVFMFKFTKTCLQPASIPIDPKNDIFWHDWRFEDV